MDIKEYIGKRVHVFMDRPLGYLDKKYNFLYPVNYGYIPGTISGDGEEIDAYVLGEDVTLEEYDGVVIAIIHRTNDDDDKLIVTDGKNISDEEIEKQTNFLEQYFEHVILR